MDLFKAIIERRSTRNFNSKKVSEKDLNFILEAGAYAPSSGDLKDFRFLVVDEPKKIAKIADIANQHWLNKVGLLIVVCSDSDLATSFYNKRGEDYAKYNAAAAIQNMLLAAHALNIRSCWVGDFDKKGLRLLLKIPQEAQCHAIIPLGYSDEKLEDPKEIDLEVNVFYGKYGFRYKKLNLILREYAKELEERLEKMNFKNDFGTFKTKLKKAFSKK